MQKTITLFVEDHNYIGWVQQFRRDLVHGVDEDVEVIMERLPKKHQSMLFSATMPVWVQRLSRKYFNDPIVTDLVGESSQKLVDGILL